MAPLRVLLTGFGPFPGVPLNPSAWLVDTLAALTQSSSCDTHVQVLPTEWEQVARLAPHLYTTLQPDVLIHFGLSRRATGLRLERSAHNRTARRPDHSGGLPPAPVIEPDGPPRRDSRLPLSSFAALLCNEGVAGHCSSFAGAYLCNYLYYLSLAWAERQQAPRFALFVHIPPRQEDGGPLSDQELVKGGGAIMRYVLQHTEQQQRETPSAAIIAPVIAAVAEAKVHL